VKGVVLAAGLGTRLNPLTAYRPKHLLPLVNSTILENVIHVLSRAGIRDIYVIVHYLKDKIMNLLGDGSRFGVNITYVEQGDVKGTAHAIGVVENFVGDNDFVVVYGDVTANVNIINRAIELYRRSGASAVMVGVEVDDPWNYGVLSIDNNGFLIKVVEKPRRGEEPSNLINAGIYVLDGSKIFDAIRKTPISPRGEYEFTDSLQILVENGNGVAVLNAGRGWWFDIGRPWDLLDANKHFLSKIAFNNMIIDGNVEIDSNVRIVPPVYIGDGSIIRNGSVIGPNTVICRNVYVGSNSVVSDSIVMSNTVIDCNCRVNYSIISENCIVESNVDFKYECSDGGTVKMIIKGKIVDSGRRKLGSVVGDCSFIGKCSIIMAGKSIYPNSIVPRYSIVFEDVRGVYLHF